MDKKYKILLISDSILYRSGVSIQTRYVAEHLLKTGRFQIVHIAVAMRHENMNVQKTHEYGDDLIIVPSTSYDDINLIRQIADAENPDVLLMVTDPRFYTNLFANAAELKFPKLYWCIWDNPPTPWYNKSMYDSVDYLGCINKVMYNIATDMGYVSQNKASYIPHGVPENDFKILYVDQKDLIKKHLPPENHKDVEFCLFYNSRNALRKRTGNVLMAYKHFLNSLPEKDRNKVFFCMNTPPKDPEGQDLYVFVDHLGLKDRVGFSPGQVSVETLNEYYNMADCTIIQSSEEGFGLSCLESLMCGTPVISGKTGGLQDQLYDPDTQEIFGFLMEPDATSVVGSQSVPYIESHHFNYEKTAQHIKTLYEEKMRDPHWYKNRWAGKKARDSMLRRFNLNDVVNKWENVIVEQIEKYREKMNNRVVEVIEI